MMTITMRMRIGTSMMMTVQYYAINSSLHISLVFYIDLIIIIIIVVVIVVMLVVAVDSSSASCC